MSKLPTTQTPTVSTATNNTPTSKATNMTTINTPLLTAMASLKKARSAGTLITALTSIKIANGIKDACENDYLGIDFKGLQAIKRALLDSKSDSKTVAKANKAEAKAKKARTPKKPKAQTEAQKAKKLAKAVIESASHVDTDEKDLSDTLHHITALKAEAKIISKSIKQDIKTVIPLINKYVKEMREENTVYQLAKKATLVKLVKTRLDSKESVIATMCDVLIEGLNIDNSHTLSVIKYTVKCVKNGSFSKTKVNKADKAQLIKMCDKQKAIEAIKRAEKLIKGK